MSGHVAIVPATFACLLADKLKAALHPLPRQKNRTLLQGFRFCWGMRHPKLPQLPIAHLQAQQLSGPDGRSVDSADCPRHAQHGAEKGSGMASLPPTAHLSSHQLTSSVAEALPISHVASGPVVA